jgi:hypothetical protein
MIAVNRKQNLPKVLYINREDLYEYFNTMKIQTKIRLFSKVVVKSLPFSLKEEFRDKYEGIELVNRRKRVFQYFVKSPSKELKKAVSEFKIMLK